jgi:hypothetical protein
MDLVHCSEALVKLTNFLTEFSPLINVCMVDFITKDVFSSVLSPDVADELSELTDDQIIALPERCLNIQKVEFQHLFNFGIGLELFGKCLRNEISTNKNSSPPF